LNRHDSIEWALRYCVKMRSENFLPESFDLYRVQLGEDCFVVWGHALFRRSLQGTCATLFLLEKGHCFYSEVGDRLAKGEELC
jgi:hypothetical protein